MDLLAKASEIFSDNILIFRSVRVEGYRSREIFRSICEQYKSFLDGNYAGRFCIDGHCKTIFMVEIRYDGSKWGATPKTFYSQEEAEKEVEALKIKYPFIREYRIVTRRIEETTS